MYYNASSVTEAVTQEEVFITHDDDDVDSFVMIVWKTKQRGPRVFRRGAVTDRSSFCGKLGFEFDSNIYIYIYLYIFRCGRQKRERAGWLKKYIVYRA